jgi:hypothetical protein
MSALGRKRTWDRDPKADIPGGDRQADLPNVSGGWFSDLLAVAPGLLLKTTLDPVRAAQLREASPVAGGHSDAERSGIVGQHTLAVFRKAHLQR